MRIRTLLLYLVGKRQAILEIANDRPALWIGLIFVLSAGFAREYDGKDLTAEPWHIIVPVGASLATSFLLFLLTFRRGDDDLSSVPFFAAYRSFLTLYWMTAPLAWIYAIPFERFLDPYEATMANLCCLGLVATWRVLLMIRVISVLMGYHVLAAVFPVLLFGDTIAVVAIQFLQVPILDLMGGIRMTPKENMLLNTTFFISFWALLRCPFGWWERLCRFDAVTWDGA
jgi:hypothetical protein